MENKIMLDEFCKTKSLSDKRVELLGGFFYWAKFTKKVQKATQAEFETLYKEFETMPV